MVRTKSIFLNFLVLSLFLFFRTVTAQENFYCNDTCVPTNNSCIISCGQTLTVQSTDTIDYFNYTLTSAYMRVNFTLKGQPFVNYDLYADWTAESCPIGVPGECTRQGAGAQDTCNQNLPVGTYIFGVKKILGAGTYNISLTCEALMDKPTIIEPESKIYLGFNRYSLGAQLEKPEAFSNFHNDATFRQLAKNADFKLIRFFDVRIGSPCKSWSEATKSCTSWDWTKIDDVVNRIYEIGAEPLIVLGYAKSDGLGGLPSGMQTNPTTLLPNKDQWAAYVAEWVKHFKNKGYPWDQVRYYEIVNEAFQYFGWTPDATKLGYYMDLYNAAAKSMRNVNPNVQLGNDESNKKDVLNKFISAGEPLNFISFHRYGTNSLSETDDQLLTNAETRYLQTTTSKYSPEDAVKAYKNAKGVELPVIMSEGNVNSAYNPNVDPRTRTIFGAVYTALSIRKFILLNISYSVYFSLGTDGTYSIGMIDTLDNKPWYPYYVQKWVGNNLAVGDRIVDSSSSSEDIRSLAWINKGKLNILLIHKSLLTNSISLQGLTGQFTYQKIDDPTGTSYLNPTIQTGTIDASNPITFNGYTVMLLQQNQPQQGIEIKGLQWYRSYSYSSTNADQSLNELSTKIPLTNYIYLDFWVDATGNNVVPRSSMESEYKSAIEKSRAKGYKIAVRIRHSPSPANLIPTDINKWFQTYTQSVVYWAKLSQSYGVELFGLGGEINRLDVDTYSNYWRNLIIEVRKVYSGKIWYNVKNWDCNYTTNCGNEGYLSYENRLKASWFKSLDYIGVSSYWDMCTHLDSSAEEMANNWYAYVDWGKGTGDMHNQNIVESLKTLSETHGKPIIIVTGLESGKNTSESFSACDKPWAWENLREVDLNVQKNWYDAVLKVFSKEPWVAGFLFDGAWYTTPNYNPQRIPPEFTIQNKPAEQVVTNWFKNLSQVGYWKFDEGSGSIAKDSSTNKNDGTIYGPAWVSGKVGKALEFDGKDDYVEVPNSNSLNPESITIEAWVYPIAKKLLTQSYGGIVRKLNSNNKQGYFLRWENNTQRVVFYMGNGTALKSVSSDSKSVPRNKWSHVVGTYDGKYMSIYVNGVLNQSKYYPGKIAPSTDKLMIGAESRTYNRFNGTIDEVKIFSRALSKDEIKTEYGGRVGPAAAEFPRISVCISDINDDGVTNIIDISMVAKVFRKEWKEDVNKDRAVDDEDLELCSNGDSRCDIDGDGIVNIYDTSIVSKAFDSEWEQSIVDIDSNGVINIMDITIVAKQFGKLC